MALPKAWGRLAGLGATWAQPPLWAPSMPPIPALGKPMYLHIGEEIDGVDMRAEVGLLTRNIVVMGEMEGSCYPYSKHLCDFFDFDTFGGHIKVGGSGQTPSADQENSLMPPVGRGAPGPAGAAGQRRTGAGGGRGAPGPVGVVGQRGRSSSVT